MGFRIRYTTDEAGTVEEIFDVIPAPTNVEYPEDRRALNQKTTQDGAVVVQRPLRDSRPRKWIWNGYRNHITGYTNLWNTLKSLDVKERLSNNLDPTVEIMEDVTEAGGFDDWTRVKILQASRVIRSGGGPVTYEQTFIEFVIADDNYSEF